LYGAAAQEMLAKKRIQGEMLDHVPDKLDSNAQALHDVKVVLL
jgi:hypothetical protein